MTPHDRLKTAFSIAEKELDIPSILQPSTLAAHADVCRGIAFLFVLVIASLFLVFYACLYASCLTVSPFYAVVISYSAFPRR